MRRLFLATTLLVAVSHTALAQTPAPVFQPITDNPALVVRKPLPQNPVPQIAPAPAQTLQAPASAVATAPSAVPARMPVSRSGEVIDSIGAGAIPALPLETLTENNVSYISGGIGDEEVAQLKSQENLFNVRLQLTGMGGEYISNVTFALHDAKGNVLVTIQDAGPYVYLQVAPGAYKAVVSNQTGGTKSASFNVKAGHAIKSQVRL